jgi:hypothetical protein
VEPTIWALLLLPEIAKSEISLSNQDLTLLLSIIFPSSPLPLQISEDALVLAHYLNNHTVACVRMHFFLKKAEAKANEMTIHVKKKGGFIMRGAIISLLCVVCVIIE